MRWVLALVVWVGCGRVGFDELCGIEGPCVSARINGGATYARGPRLTLEVETSSDDAGQEVFVKEAPCELPADAAWRPHVDDAPVALLVEPVDGVKEACVWVRDATGVGFASETIAYETLNPPRVEQLEVMPLDATRARATWTVSDVEGLAAQPVELEIRTGAMWMPLAANLGDGATSPATGTYDFDMPALPFIVRATVRDRAGNDGVSAISDVIGAPGWSIYAGTGNTKYALSARSLALEFSDNTSYMFAIDPATLDAYAVERDLGVIRVDGATGEASLFIGVGNDTLPADGPLPANATLTQNPSLHFAPDGNLYVGTGTMSGSVSGVIYQIDPTTLHVRRYLGGGTVNDQTATPSTVYATKHVFAFDEDGTIYFLTSCTPGTLPSPARFRLMKAARNADGTAGAISVVAGDCTTAAPPATGPNDPLAVPLPVFRQFPSIGTIAVFDHGNSIYLGSLPNTAWKIVDGELWPTDLPASTEGTLGYDPGTGRILVGSGPVQTFTPGGASATDPVSGELMHDDGDATCSDDGVPAASACVHVGFGLQGTAARTYVADGTAINANRAYRIRFVDTSGRMQTYVGSRSFYGDGLHRRSIRARMGAIVYKPANANNQAAFPSGLYLTDPLDVLLVRIDPATDRASIVWGNRSGSPHPYTPGESIGPDKSLGFAYGAGNLRSFAFDTDGLPVLRYGATEKYAPVISVTSARQAAPMSNGTADWERMVDGADPATADMWPYGGGSNFTYYAGVLFLLGGYTNFNPTATLKRLDFVTHQATRLMGSGADGLSADTATPATASLSATCHDNALACFTRYRSSEDRLYFSEQNRLRYLTTPMGASQTLVTLFTAPLTIHNFTFRPDGSQIYYVNGQLYCHDISSGSAVCNDTALGPPMVIGDSASGPDQLTWIDNNTLLVSTQAGYVLQYTVQ